MGEASAGMGKQSRGRRGERRQERDQTFPWAVLAKFFINVSFCVIYLYTTEVYRTRMRTTVIGADKQLRRGEERWKTGQRKAMRKRAGEGSDPL